MKSLKEVFTDLRMLKIEEDKKKLIEDKKKNILQTFQKKETSECPIQVERPRKKLISNPFAQKLAHFKVF